MSKSKITTEENPVSEDEWGPFFGVRIPSHHVPDHPGARLLKDYLMPLRISQTAAAQALGISYVRLNEIINGHRGITADTALRLEKVFGASAQSWLAAQVVWDLCEVMRSGDSSAYAHLPVLNPPAKRTTATSRGRKSARRRVAERS